jgi:phospholipid-transporting ATPase
MFTSLDYFTRYIMEIVFFLIHASYKRTCMPQPYHIVQEIQKFNIPDYRPRQEWFRKAVHKVRAIQRIKQTRGFAFSQNESGQAGLIRSYDTTLRKPKG